MLIGWHMYLGTCFPYSRLSIFNSSVKKGLTKIFSVSHTNDSKKPYASQATVWPHLLYNVK
jgi:hypothetical protein